MPPGRSEKVLHKSEKTYGDLSKKFNIRGNGNGQKLTKINVFMIVMKCARAFVFLVCLSVLIHFSL